MAVTAATPAHLANGDVVRTQTAVRQVERQTAVAGLGIQIVLMLKERLVVMPVRAAMAPVRAAMAPVRAVLAPVPPTSEGGSSLFENEFVDLKKKNKADLSSIHLDLIAVLDLGGVPNHSWATQPRRLICSGCSASKPSIEARPDCSALKLRLD